MSIWQPLLDKKYILYPDGRTCTIHETPIIGRETFKRCRKCEEGMWGCGGSCLFINRDYYCPRCPAERGEEVLLLVKGETNHRALVHLYYTEETDSFTYYDIMDKKKKKIVIKAEDIESLIRFEDIFPDQY